MKICYVTPFYPATLGEPDEMLRRWPLLRRLPPALAKHGNTVVVLAHAERAATFALDDVTYRFFAHGRLSQQYARLIHHWKPRYGPAYYLPAVHLAAAVRSERPDVVHFAGLTLDPALGVVSRTCRRLGVPLVVHFHGGVPERGRWGRLQRRNGARIASVLFTTQEQAQPWLAAGILKPRQVSLVVESSSPYHGIERATARATTGMAGDPVYLSAGRLDAIKDPLTTLRGFEAIAAQQPAARLYLYYLTAEMLADVHAFLAERPDLSERVELRGTASPEQMEAIYSSADFVIQASLREWSGLAIIEAMSCGCIPIVTDIPSFRMLTDGGRAGRLFPVGDHSALAQAVLSLSPDERLELAEVVRTRFAESLSFPAMTSSITQMYRELVRGRFVGQTNEERFDEKLI